MSDSAILVLVLVLAVVALILVGWVLYLAAGLVLGFTAFVMELPLAVVIIMFILFPPALVVFLIGLAMIKLGIPDALATRGSEAAPPAEHMPSAKTQDSIVTRFLSAPRKRDRESERKARAAKGYDR